jgi:multisubunit Na+/H+ antiporter MnhE subunit
MPQSDLADLILGFIIGIFYAAVLYLFVHRATAVRRFG